MVNELVQSHGLQPLTGERLGGEDLPAEIKRRIDACDALICLLTERPADRNNDWVRDERAHADAKGKRIIAVVQKGLDDGGLYQNRERIEYDPADPVPSLLKLSATLGLWRQEAGRLLVAQIEPDEAVQFLASQLGYATVKYRCWDGPQHSDWRDDATTKKVPGGLQLFLPSVRENQDIELEIKNANQTWESSALSQVFRIPLSRRQ